MSFELAVFYMFMGGILCLVFLGVGIVIGRIGKDGNNTINNGGFNLDRTSGDIQRLDKRELVGDSDDDAYMDERTSDRGNDNGCDKQMGAREVINGLQTLRTEISPQEKEYLDYACDCVERIERLRNYIERTKNAEG